jgi:hypothetical protein
MSKSTAWLCLAVPCSSGPMSIMAAWWLFDKKKCVLFDSTRANAKLLGVESDDFPQGDDATPGAWCYWIRATKSGPARVSRVLPTA